MNNMTEREKTIVRHLSGSAIILAALSMVFTPNARGAQILLDFDSVTAAACTDGTAYLAAYGISVTGQASARICLGVTTPGVGGAVAVSGPNLLLLDTPLPTNSTYDFFFNFSAPVSNVSFYRTAIQATSTGPAWTANALAADNSIIASVGEGTTFEPAAQLFQLPGTGIVRIEFNTNNTSARTYNVPPIDNFSFTTAQNPAPEPSAALLLAAGLGLIIALRKRRGAAR